MYRSLRPSSAALALLGAFALLGSSACSRPRPVEEGTAPGVEMRPRTLSAEPGSRGAAGAAPPAAPALKPLPPPPIASARAFGLAAPPGPILPADFRLGPLQDRRPAAGGEEALILEPALAFLEALGEGRLREESVLPERRALLPSLLSALLEGPQPASFRLGRIVREGEAALARIRLEAAPPAGLGPRLRPPRAEGELRLRRAEGAWYVEDLALDPAELAREAPPPGPAFEPGYPAP